MTLKLYHQLLLDASLYLKDQVPNSFVFGSYSGPEVPFERKRDKTQLTKPMVKNFSIKKEQEPLAIQIPVEVGNLEEKITLPPITMKKAKEEIKLPSLEIKKTLYKIAPKLHLLDTIPDDAQARRIRDSWKERIDDIEVIILSLEQSEEEMTFLKNLAKAIQSDGKATRILSGKRLEEENMWDLFLDKNVFRLIIASNGMKNYPRLMSQYKALPAQGLAFLGKTPLISLFPASTYNQFKQEKTSLWKRICQTLA